MWGGEGERRVYSIGLVEVVDGGGCKGESTLVVREM